MNEAWYPAVSQGTQVIWAPGPDAAESRWILGDVAITKNNSCDIRLADGSMKGDCLYVGDPRCRETKDWAIPSRGVFKLSPCEIEQQDWFRRRLPALEAKMRRIEVMLDELAMAPRIAPSLAGSQQAASSPPPAPRRPYTRRATPQQVAD